MIKSEGQNYTMSTDSPNSFQETDDSDFIPYRFEKLSNEEMIRNSTAFYDEMATRRSVRVFSTDDVPFEVIKQAILTAGSAPSGANKQPWTFCVVSNKELKAKIRDLAEKEEYESYTHRMNAKWLEDLKPFNTNHKKPHLEDAPYLIVIFKKPYEIENGEKNQNYYVNESVGIATGFLLCALHKSGLSTLTHTPSPMGFLTKLLNRPDNERPYLLIPVGYPHPDLKVPNIMKHPVSKILVDYK